MDVFIVEHKDPKYQDTCVVFVASNLWIAFSWVVGELAKGHYTDGTFAIVQTPVDSDSELSRRVWQTGDPDPVFKNWIGFDLDRTLAEYGSWHADNIIGKPIPAMIAKVKEYLAQGKWVKIFTARVSSVKPPEKIYASRKAIEAWCLEHIGQVLEITSEKDIFVEELWDDVAVQVIPNKGIRADGRV